jgi:NADPH:quinone reductase-like Zn-dependent oxidoreductase
MSRSALSARGVTLVGFTLTRPLATYPREKVRALYADLARQVMEGTLRAPVEKVYAIDEITTALAHAQRGERGGKILVAPNGPV